MKALIRFGLLAGLLATLSRAETPGFRFDRELVPGGPGANRVGPDAALLGGVAYTDLRDLRFCDTTSKASKEMPYLLIPPETAEPRWKTGRILPVAETKEISGFEIDLGEATLVDRLRLTGLPAPFLKRFQLEGSGDRSHWTLLKNEGTLFDLPDERLHLTETAFESGQYRYLRVTWDDRQSGRIPQPPAASARIFESRTGPTPLRVQGDFRPLASSPGHSRFQVRLPGPHLPLAAIEISVKETRLLRNARVTESVLSGAEAQQQVLGNATLRRVSQGGLVAEDLRIPVRPPTGSEIEIVVDDDSNPHLDLARVDLVFAPQPWIYFESTSGQPLTARYGDSRLKAPHYDLEAIRQFVGRTDPKPARWGDIQTPAPAIGTTDSTLDAVNVGGGGAIDTKSFRFSRRIPASSPGLSALVLDADVLAHSRMDLSDLRIAVETKDGPRQIPYLLERRQDTFSLDLELKPETAADAASKRSRYRLTLPFDNLPAAKLTLSTTERVFQRNLAVEAIEPKDASAGKYRPRMSRGVVTLAAATWRHDEPETSAPPLSLDLREGLATQTVTLVVDEGDNRPLRLTTARLELPLYRMRFFYPDQGKLDLLYGSPTLLPPRYDLELLAPRLIGLSSQEVRLAPEDGARVPASLKESPSEDARIFWVALGGAVLVILLLLARLLRSEPARG